MRSALRLVRGDLSLHRLELLLLQPLIPLLPSGVQPQGSVQRGEGACNSQQRDLGKMWAVRKATGGVSHLCLCNTVSPWISRWNWLLRRGRSQELRSCRLCVKNQKV